MSSTSGLQVKFTLSVTLVSGTATVNNPRIFASDIAIVSLKEAIGTLGDHYSLSCADGLFSIASVDNSGAIVNTDNSTLYVGIFDNKLA